jgi:catechol 2,3-dioxygenase-like lactoylglutathione lyase family enzyme
MLLKPQLMYTGIRVKNLDESLKFYTEVMGMKIKERYPIDVNNSEVAVVVSKDGGPEIELNYYKEGSKFNEPYSSGQELDHLAFWLGEDYDSFLAEAKKKGYDTVLEVKIPPNHRHAFIKDPNGIFILIA